MVTEPSQHGGKGVGFMDDEPRVQVTALRDIVDIGRDVLVDRAGALTGRDGNVEAQVPAAAKDLVGSRVGRRLADLLEDLVGTHLRGTGRTDGLQNSAEGRHQAAAIANATSRAVRAPSGMPE